MHTGIIRMGCEQLTQQRLSLRKPPLSHVEVCQRSICIAGIGIDRDPLLILLFSFRGMLLFEQGTGKRLLITGVNKTSTKEELQRRARGGTRFACCADLGYAAEDTYGNAVEAADWTASHHYKSLVVVTASYHMPRSLRLFHSLMPGVRLVPYPVEPEGVNLSAWWHPGTLHLLHNEYLKYLASFVMTAVDHHADDDKPKSGS